MKCVIKFIPIFLSSIWTQSVYCRDSISVENYLGDQLAYFKEYPQNFDNKKLNTWLSLAEQQSSPYFQGKIYQLAGEVNYSKGLFDESLRCYSKALNFREKYNYSAHAASSMESIAQVYFSMEEPKTALTYLYSSLSIKKMLGRDDYLLPLFTRLGHAHYWTDNMDSSIYYYQNAIALAYKLNDTIGVADGYVNVGDVFYYFDDYQKAVENYHLSLKLYENQNRKVKSISVLHNLADLYHWIDQQDSAQYYYTKGMRIAEERGDYTAYGQLIRGYADLLVTQNKSDSATFFYDRYLNYRDSVFSSKKNAFKIEFDKKYKTQQAKQKATLATKEKQIAQAQNASQQKTIYILLASFIILLGSVIFFYRNMRNRARLKALELDLKNKEIDNIMKDQEAKSYAALLEGQNTERERIAQDLHDRLGGTLAAVKVHFSQMDDKIDALKTENKGFFQKVNGLLNDAVQDVRRISHDLASKRLAKLGLKGALEDLAEMLRKSKNMTVECVIDNQLEELPEWKEQEIYALFQEMVSNTLKHSGATQVEMQLNRIDTDLTITFEDNGAGFDPKKSNLKGLGLSGMDKRVRRMKGTLNIDTLIGRGTIIMINIPL